MSPQLTTENSELTTATPNVQQAVPFFWVANMEASLRFYVDGLGYTRTKQWIVDNKSGRRKYSKLLKADLTHSIEKVGAQLRARMPWLESGKA